MKIIAGISISAVQLLDHDAKEEDFDDHSYGSGAGRRQAFGMGTPRFMENESEVEQEDFEDQREVLLHRVELCGHFYSYLEICYNILESLFNIYGLYKFKVFLQFTIFLHTWDEWNILQVWRLKFFEVLLTRYRNLCDGTPVI